MSINTPSMHHVETLLGLAQLLEMQQSGRIDGKIHYELVLTACTR